MPQKLLDCIEIRILSYPYCSIPNNSVVSVAELVDHTQYQVVHNMISKGAAQVFDKALW